MSSQATRVGTEWETRIARFFQQVGVWSEMGRRRTEGQNDKAEFHSGPRAWALEAKAEKRIDLPRYMREAQREAGNLGVRFYAAVVKRRNHKVGQAYFVMELERARQLIFEHEQALAILDDLGIDIGASDRAVD